MERWVIKLDKRVIVFVLPFILMALTIPRTQFSNGALGFSATLVNTNSAGPENSQLVSVAYNPLIMSYPDKSMSPYGPEVSPVYNLTKQALVYLNPENPGNPLSNIIQPGDTVVLKPNLVGTSAFAREGCTRTPVLRPLVDLAVQAGASKVIIAEGSATPYPDSIVFGPEYSNITGLVQDLQNMYPTVVITYKDLNLDNFTWVDLGENSTFYGVYTPQQLYSVNRMRMDEDSYYYAQDCNGYDPKGYRPGLYAIANTVFQADVFINVPKMKVHWITGVTLSLKNLIGITVSSTGNTTHEEGIKDVPHWNNSEPAHDEVLTRRDSFANDVVWRVMADLNKIVLYADNNGVLQPLKQRRYLSVVDAIIGMEGPTVYNPPGVLRPTGAIIVGQNPVAVDAVSSRVMGFNYTVLNSVVNMEQISDHPIGKADPITICVVGTSLNGTTFGEPYVPHQDYEDPKIAPYKIRLQCFDPPKAIFIKTYPGTPRGNVATKVIAYTLDIERVATGWLNFSLNGNETQIVKMSSDQNAVIAEIGKLNASTDVSYSVCMQDLFFNTAWYPKLETSVVPSTHPYVEILTPQFGFYNNTLTLTLNVTKGQLDIDTVWYAINESAPTTLEAPYTTQLTLVKGTHLITAHVNDTLGCKTMDETMVFISAELVYSELTPSTLYKLDLSINGTLIYGNNLTLKFYSYSGTYQAETSIWNGTTPTQVEISTQVQHPLNLPIENATLGLTDNAGNVLSTIAAFIMCRSHLMGRLGELDYLWTVPDEDRSVIMKEYVAIDGQWPYAPP